jgi:hypothetical protein
VSWLVPVIAFVATLTILRFWLGSRWRAGMLSVQRAALVIAALWATFPFVGLAAGAPWGLPIVVVISLVMFLSVLTAGILILTRFAA